MNKSEKYWDSCHPCQFYNCLQRSRMQRMTKWRSKHSPDTDTEGEAEALPENEPENNIKK